MAASKTLTPAQRTERARNAALARTTPRAHVEAIIRAAGKLTDEDIARLRSLLPPPKAAPAEGAA